MTKKSHKLDELNAESTDEKSISKIDNEKINNVNNNSFCYLTKVEIEILRYLIIEKEVSKKYF